jgi:DNA-binding CsgD family transcriptional regulator
LHEGEIDTTPDRFGRGEDRWAPYGAAAGAIAIVLYVVGSVVMGTPPDFDAPGADVAAYLDEERTRIQVGSAIHAAWAPLFVWFLATVASLTRAGGTGTRRAGAVAFGCGLTFLALFLADVASVAVGALRPENMAAAPELAAALHDFSWLAMGMAAFLVSGARLEHARALVELGASIRRSGRRRQAREPLRDALAIANNLGGSALAERAREELFASGARPRSEALKGRDSLTPSELRVALMAAEGLSNREIAQDLFVTVRTVESHLSRAYDKLEIRSRGELGRALEEPEAGEAPAEN